MTLSKKTTRVLFWVTTVIIFLFEGVMVALTSHTELAREGVAHLGYPDYFRYLLGGFKVSGSLALIIPAVSARIKEWAYAGFGFVFVSAFVSHAVVDGLSNGMTYFPLVFLGILAVSYRTFHTMSK